MSALGCDQSILGLVDAGEARDTRPVPCHATWCCLPEHEGDHLEIPRRAMPPSDFGPRRAVTSRRAHVPIEPGLALGQATNIADKPNTGGER